MVINFEGEGIYETSVDTQLLKLVVMNLIVNSYHHNSKDNKTLTISIEKRSKYFRITFKDNGDGIDDKNFKKVFKKFYQGDNSAKGSGLGLYLVQTVMKALGGSAFIKESTLSVGTSICIDIPIKE